jgi:hypothetical protein
LVEATSAGADDLDQAVDTAASLGAVAIANSYTSPEDPISLTADDPHYDHPGVAITAASGDSGYQPNADPANGDRVPYPASSPHVIAAGATSLTTDATTVRGWAETAWSSTAGASGSGCSAFEPKPAWQPDTGCAHRMVTDVSVVGDPGTGLAVYDSTPFQDSPGHYVVPGWTVLAGTSASAALLAGMYALAGTSVDYPARLAYQAPAAMADVTGGSTSSCAPASWCTAGPGYDGPTGLGTPVALAGMQQPSPAGGFRPLPPTRILDTRLSPGVPVGSKATLPLKVTGVAGVPDGAVSAVAMNVTATNIQSTGYLAVYPHGGAVPGVSNINYIPGRDIPNSVVVPVGDGGVVDLYNGSNGGTTDMVAAVSGY